MRKDMAALAFTWYAPSSAFSLAIGRAKIKINHQIESGVARRRRTHDWISRCAGPGRHHHLPVSGTWGFSPAWLRAEGLHEPVDCKLERSRQRKKHAKSLHWQEQSRSGMFDPLLSETRQWRALQHSVASTLGTQIPHAVSAGYALKMQDRLDPSRPPRVAVAYFGEGAASEGDFHGALNMTAMMNSPVVFICRNNGYAISTPASEQYKGDGIASRGAGYGIETLRVDGTDIFAVYEATKAARQKALENGGRPILLELMSYRMSHHSTSDDSSAYRSTEEVSSWKESLERNSILRLRQWLESEGGHLGR